MPFLFLSCVSVLFLFACLTGRAAACFVSVRRFTSLGSALAAFRVVSVLVLRFFFVVFALVAVCVRTGCVSPTLCVRFYKCRNWLAMCSLRWRLGRPSGRGWLEAGLLAVCLVEPRLGCPFFVVFVLFLLRD